MSGRSLPSWFRIAGRAAVATTAALVLVAVIAAGVLAALGHRPVVIQTGSMGDTAPPGSLVIARPVDHVAVGDVLVMRTEDRATITHRVVDLEERPDGLVAVTRGDANPDIDPQPYALGEQELTARWVVPDAGRLLLTIRTPLVGLGLLLFVVATIAFIALRRIWAPARTTVPPPPISSNSSSTPPPPPPPRSGGQRVRVLALLRGSDPRARRAIVAAASLGSVAVIGGAAMSLYASVGTVAANSFSTRECYDARLGSVQTGQHVNNANGTSTVAITAVDPAKSFLLMSVSSIGDQPGESAVAGRLASATTLEFERNTSAGSPADVVVEWSVVEYDCGVSVQRGTATTGGTTAVDVPITAVDTTASFPLLSAGADATATTFDSAALQTIELTSPTNLRIEAASSVPAAVPLDWQVVTFDGGDASTQQLTATLGLADTTANVTVPTTVDPDSTAVFVSTRAQGTGVTIGDRLVRARLLDGDTVEVTRSVTGDPVDVVIHVVEFADGTTVYRGVTDLTAAQSLGTASIPPVQPSRSTVTSTTTLAGGSAGGSTPHVADDTVGEASGRFTLADARTVEVRRDLSASSASFGWQVITWNGPNWADLQSPFRQRIDIAGGAVITPNGYTTPLTFDHAQLVTDGLSLSDGSDIRIWRHDGTTWTELHRVLDDESSWNGASTTVWFRTQEAIAADTTASYWLYFGDDTPAAALEDPNQVWLVTEGFDDGTLGSFEDRTGGSTWYDDTPWTNRIVIDIDGSGLAGAVTDHPVLVRVTDASLGATLQADASDARFTASDGTTVLPHQIEDWDSGTNTLTAWVRVPSVGTGTTSIHLYTGSSAAADQSDARAAWAGRVAAWLMAADPATDRPALDDDGPNQRDGVALADAAAVSTPSGPGLALDGALDRVESQPFTLGNAPFTVSAVFRADSIASSPVIALQGNPTTSGVWDLVVSSGTSQVEGRISVGGSVYTVSGGSISPGSWHHVAMAWDGTAVELFVDGVSVGSTATTGSLAQPGDIAVTIGADAGGARALDGMVAHASIDAAAWTGDRALLDAGLFAGTRTSAASITSGTWFEQGTWSARWPLTVDADSVAGTLTDYPLLVNLTNTDIAAAARADGADIVFTADDGATRLDHWIESWNDGTGELVAWVRVPTLNSAADTGLFLYAGNASADDQQDPTAVWGPDADLIVANAS